MTLPVRRPWPRTGRRVETINGIRNWWVYRLGPKEWEAREFLNEDLVDTHGFKRLKDTTSWCLSRRRMEQQKLERPMLNGYPIYNEGEKCHHCGKVQTQSEADKKKGDPPGYLLTCPECYREGCEECMPAGRGCMCPDCEEGGEP